MPVATRTFTPYDKRKCEEAYEKAPMPVATKYFTEEAAAKKAALAAEKPPMPVGKSSFVSPYASQSIFKLLTVCFHGRLFD